MPLDAAKRTRCRHRCLPPCLEPQLSHKFPSNSSIERKPKKSKRKLFLDDNSSSISPPNTMPSTKNEADIHSIDTSTSLSHLEPVKVTPMDESYEYGTDDSPNEDDTVNIQDSFVHILQINSIATKGSNDNAVTHALSPRHMLKSLGEDSLKSAREIRIPSSPTHLFEKKQVIFSEATNALAATFVANACLTDSMDQGNTLKHKRNLPRRKGTPFSKKNKRDSNERKTMEKENNQNSSSQPAFETSSHGSNRIASKESSVAVSLFGQSNDAKKKGRNRRADFRYNDAFMDSNSDEYCDDFVFSDSIPLIHSSSLIENWNNLISKNCEDPTMLRQTYWEYCYGNLKKDGHQSTYSRPPLHLNTKLRPPLSCTYRSILKKNSHMVDNDMESASPISAAEGTLRTPQRTPDRHVQRESGSQRSTPTVKFAPSSAAEFDKDEPVQQSLTPLPPDVAAERFPTTVPELSNDDFQESEETKLNSALLAVWDEAYDSDDDFAQDLLVEVSNSQSTRSTKQKGRDSWRKSFYLSPNSKAGDPSISASSDAISVDKNDPRDVTILHNNVEIPWLEHSLGHTDHSRETEGRVECIDDLSDIANLSVSSSQHDAVLQRKYDLQSRNSDCAMFQIETTDSPPRYIENKMFHVPTAIGPQEKEQPFWRRFSNEQDSWKAEVEALCDSDVLDSLRNSSLPYRDEQLGLEDEIVDALNSLLAGSPFLSAAFQREMEILYGHVLHLEPCTPFSSEYYFESDTVDGCLGSNEAEGAALNDWLQLTINFIDAVLLNMEEGVSAEIREVLVTLLAAQQWLSNFEGTTLGVRSIPVALLREKEHLAYLESELFKERNLLIKLMKLRTGSNQLEASLAHLFYRATRMMIPWGLSEDTSMDHICLCYRPVVRGITLVVDCNFMGDISKIEILDEMDYAECNDSDKNLIPRCHLAAGCYLKLLSAGINYHFRDAAYGRMSHEKDFLFEAAEIHILSSYLDRLHSAVLDLKQVADLFPVSAGMSPDGFLMTISIRTNVEVIVSYNVKTDGQRLFSSLPSAISILQNGINIPLPQSVECLLRDSVETADPFNILLRICKSVNEM